MGVSDHLETQPWGQPWQFQLDWQAKTPVRIVLCTDGMANNGVGAIRNRNEIVPFYAELGRRAAEEGTMISIITMEGEDCSMENLGVCADLTGGQVDMINLEAMSSSV